MLKICQIYGKGVHMSGRVGMDQGFFSWDTLSKYFTVVLGYTYSTMCMPDATFKLTSFKHAMEHVIKIPHKCHNFFHKLVMLVSLKVPSGVRMYNVPPAARKMVP